MRQEEAMDAIPEDSHLAADIDAQPLVQAAAALQPCCGDITRRSSVSSACRQPWSSSCMPPASTEW